MKKSIFFHQNWFYMFVLQILLAITLLSANIETVYANAVTPEIPTVSDNENQFLVPEDEKDEYGDYNYPWNNIAVTEDDFNTDLIPVMVFFANSTMLEELTKGDNGKISDDNMVNQKRGWKKMNVAWGKRRNGGQFTNRATGSWGKREPNWNNLKGMWGKRSDTYASSDKRAQWDKLKGMWGKRSDIYDSLDKRAQWDQLKGMWGKRSDIYDSSDKRAQWDQLKGMWGKRSAQWERLKGSWGKRSAEWDELKGMWGKRSPQWERLKGSWGKRSAQFSEDK